MKSVKHIFSIDFLKSCKNTFKNEGFKALIKKEGWSIVVIFFLFYLVRDSIFYILIPYVGISGLVAAFSPTFIVLPRLQVQPENLFQ